MLPLAHQANAAAQKQATESTDRTIIHAQNALTGQALQAANNPGLAPGEPLAS